MKTDARKDRAPTVVFFVIILILIFYFTLTFDETNLVEINHSRSFDFDDILIAEVQPENGKNVFFVESGDTEINVTLKIRQTCSIESAAFMNPHLKVFVLFTSKERLRNLSRTPEVEAILSYPNVFVNSIDIERFSLGTPFQEFIQRKVLLKSSYKVVHTSDVVRFMVLWRYGGTYLDTDIIVRKKLDSIPPNYGCPESETFMNNAAINFQSINENYIIEAFVYDLIRNFNGQSWGHNGPTMMTRVLTMLCNTNQTLEMLHKGNCKSFHVMRKETCYPVGGMQASQLFTDSLGPKTMEVVKDSLVVHFWNSATKGWKLKKSQSAAYIQLAKEFCPKVMAQEGDDF